MTAKIIPFERKEPVCSFCKKPKSKVTHLIKGNSGAHICEECLKKCKERLNEDSS